jgi:hypothetical protein
MIQSSDPTNGDTSPSPGLQRPPAFVAPRNRDAWSTIRGFVYQADLTIERWLHLEPEQDLQLECGEDIDTVSQYIQDGVEERLLEQVKHRQESVTLKHASVLTALANAAMSYDENDAAYDRFIDEVRNDFREEAFNDAEIYETVVDDFKASRLSAFYAQTPAVAAPAQGALQEATALLEAHPRAALVFAIMAAEVCLRRALLTPLLHGAFHTEASADVLAHLVAATKDEKLVKALLRILAVHTGVDLQVHRRPTAAKPLWEEMHELQGKRNAVIHQAATVSPTDAQQAIAVAETMLTDIFPTVIARLGLHLHEGPRVCDSTNCGAGSIP